MARVYEEDVIIRISRIIRDNITETESVLTDEIYTTIEAVVSELVEGCVVEVSNAKEITKCQN